MTQNMKLEDSITLAHWLQGAVVDGMAKPLGEVKDLGVKKALFYVLVGARMPSVLVEMFFITNRQEGRAIKISQVDDFSRIKNTTGRRWRERFSGIGYPKVWRIDIMVERMTL